MSPCVRGLLGLLQGIHRVGNTVECLSQAGSGTGEVEPLESVALAVEAKHGAVVGGDLGLVNHEIPQFLVAQAQGAEVQPSQISMRYGYTTAK